MPALQSRRGVAALYAVLIFAVILGIAALAVDFGRVVCSKGELQGAADAAARSGAAGLATSTTQANSNAKQKLFLLKLLHYTYF